MLLGAPVAALAATSITNLTLDGLSNTTVDAGDDINARVVYDITSNDDSESLSWELVGSGLPKTCVNIQDQLNSGTFHPEFDIDTTGATAGVWDIEVELYGTNGTGANQLCTNPSDDSMTFTNVVSIEEDSDSSGGSGNGGNGNNTGSDNTPAWLVAFQAQIAAMIAALTPATPPVVVVPPANTACAEYATLSAGLSQGSDTRPGGRVGQLQSFLMYKGFNIPLLSSNQAPYGFYGSQSAFAAASFVMANHCV